ncbi:MAG: hypothetical protein Q7J13_13345 [Brevundimonas sp.]|uniref:hypothetical protein n=1 Tax=Brevundimonas sp. TaxID=1871086 RepID=UPI00272871E6|nr:hypothetical protein [Brevundimonas sp.]MDO9588905.1 hypothetical protein [Brevundimonas sp.]
MTVRTARFAAFAAVSVLMMAFAQSTPGTPIQGTAVGLEGDPGSIVAPGRTDARGEAVFAVGPGRYSVFLINPSVPTIVTVTPVNDAPVMISVPIMPGRGRVYAVDAAGRRLFVRKAGGGDRDEYLRVTLTEAGPVAAPRR